MFKYIKQVVKYLILVLIALPVYAGGPLQSARTFKNNGGLIDHISPLLIDDTHASAIQNITMDDRGLLSKRNGFSVIQTTSVLASTQAVTGGTYHTATTGSNFFTVVVGSDIYRTSNLFTNYSRVTGSVSITAASSNLAQSTHLQDQAVFCNESDKPFYIGSSGNAATISTNTFDTAKTCATYGSYLVVANTSESSTAFPSRVRWSDINNINSFPALNFIDVEPDDGDKIVGIISYDEEVFIFKKRSIYEMRITGLDGPDAFIIRPISRNVGAWAKNSIKVVPHFGVVFLAQNTLYVLNTSYASQYSDSGLTPIGDPIQRTFDTVSRGMWANAVAGVYPHKYQYWIAVSTDGVTNSEVLVYDYIQKNWTVFTNMYINMLSQAEDSTGQNILISGDYHGVTYKQDVGASDNQGGNSQTISGQYTTANLSLGAEDITKGYKYLYIYSLGDVVYSMKVEAAYDYNSSYEYSTTVQLGSKGALYDTGIYDVDIYPTSGYNVSRVELNREARAIRLRFTNSNSGEVFGLLGWTLVYQSEDYKQ